MLATHARSASLSPRVTVVNDNPEFLALIGEILTSDRIVATLIDGDRPDALEQIRQSNPDVLMIDLRLGADGLHGWDIAQEVRRDAQLGELPILVCSADHQAMNEIADQSEAEKVALLRKPFALAELTEAIDRLLDRGVPA